MKKLPPFDAYLEHYLTAHQNKTNQWIHAVALILSIVCFILFLISWNLLWLILTPVFGHGIAWIGHQFYEGNRPLVWQNPIYAFFAEVILVKRLLFNSIKL